MLADFVYSMHAFHNVNIIMNSASFRSYEGDKQQERSPKRQRDRERSPRRDKERSPKR